MAAATARVPHCRARRRFQAAARVSAAAVAESLAAGCAGMGAAALLRLLRLLSPLRLAGALGGQRAHLLVAARVARQEKYRNPRDWLPCNAKVDRSLRQF